MPKFFRLILLAALSVISAGAGMSDAAEAVVNPWVTTDRSVNTFDAASLIADVTRGLTDPQEQAIALFSYFRRTTFPYANRNEYPFPENDQSRMFDFSRIVNVYGYALCTQVNWMFASLCKQSGLFEDARGISVPGHGTSEVKWGGQWHFMDPIVGCYVLNHSGQVASIDEINADPTLLSQAVAQNRASMPFCPWGGESMYPEGALAQLDQWLTYRKYGLEFLLGALPDYKPQTVNEQADHTMAFNLRPGYKLRRLWDHQPGMYNNSYEFFRNNRGRTSPSPAILPPHHPVGAKEARDQINWPVIKPYKKTIKGRDAYHYFANGILSYSDDFTGGGFLQAADSVSGLALERQAGALQLSPGATGGSAIFPFELPYVFVGGSVSGRVALVDGGWAAVYMEVSGGGRWLCLGVLERSGDFSFELPKELVEERYDFRLKVKLHGENGPASARLLELDVQAVCQLNMYSLPFLAPGANRVSVHAQSIPAGGALAVTYKWEENGWQRSHRYVAASPGESYTVQVAGDDYPRMKEVVIECLPLK